MLTRAEIKKKLPRGAAETIAKNVGVSKTIVYRFLNGGGNNEAVELAALEFLVKHKEVQNKKEELAAKIG